MGRVLSRALEAAGLSDFQARVQSGTALTSAELAELRDVDLLLLASLADVMRAHHHGDRVRIVRAPTQLTGPWVVFDGTPTEHGATGAELLREIALLRLATPPSSAVAISMETLGLELAQTALLFGADTLIGDLGSARTLPLLEGSSARRIELAGLVTRSGRRASFIDASEREEQHAEAP
ncbi:MAG: hypothetical protein ABW321_18480 [Polyangiales bacterium]